MAKISIVIPVYNVEKYIDKCINSILNQTYKDFEIIIVDDGSKDKSGSICDLYESNYSNIKVIHKENGGLSDARNVGIDNSNGSYIMFVDSDDYIDDKMCLEKLVNSLNNQDVLQFKLDYYFEKKNKVIASSDYNTDINGYKDILDYLVCSGQYMPSASAKLINLSFLKNNNLYFKKDLLSEDIMWSFELFLKAKSIKLLNETSYIYRKQREGSITNKFTKQHIESLYYIINYWYNYDYEDEKIKKIYFNYIAYQYVNLLSLINKNNTDSNLRAKIYELKELLNYDKNKKVRLSNKVLKVLGIKLGRHILKIYVFLKNKGIVKL